MTDYEEEEEQEEEEGDFEEANRLMDEMVEAEEDAAYSDDGSYEEEDEDEDEDYDTPPLPTAAVRERDMSRALRRPEQGVSVRTMAQSEIDAIERTPQEQRKKQVWERLDCENQKQFDWFTLYLNMTPTRSAERVGQHFTPSGKRYGYMKEVAAKYKWQYRARAKDRHEEDERKYALVVRKEREQADLWVQRGMDARDWIWTGASEMATFLQHRFMLAKGKKLDPETEEWVDCDPQKLQIPDKDLPATMRTIAQLMQMTLTSPEVGGMAHTQGVKRVLTEEDMANMSTEELKAAAARAE